MTSTTASPSFSIVIATYRRLEMVRDTVRSLRELDIPDGERCEVLMIDNDPDGSARALAAELKAECREFELRYVHEQRTGLSFARNRGIEEACGAVIAFLDDDMFIDHGWMCAILACMRESGAAVVGGRTLVLWEDAPHPLVASCERAVLNLDYGDGNCPMRGRRLPGGGNAAFRREVFQDGLRFSTQLGRVGPVLLSGEDTLMFLTLADRGESVWYCAGAAVQHRLVGERTAPEYVRRQKFWFGISYAIIDRLRRGRLYQFRQAAARCGKVLLVDTPRYVWSLLSGNESLRFLAQCSLRKQAGYLRAVLLPLRVSDGSQSEPAVMPSTDDSASTRHLNRHHSQPGPGSSDQRVFDAARN